jgi:prolyl oligopeptidase
VTGYGGYGLSREPSFRPVLRVLFDHGFVWAEANLRGGGEFGEAWHHDGALTKKQNVFDDFAAVLKHMIAQKYTSAEHLAIEGGSNGGLLMGAMITQHPGLMRTVVTHVGIYDMLRVELSPNGAFNIPEFGTVKDAEQSGGCTRTATAQRQGRREVPGGAVLTGANDPRVDPMQSRKMTALAGCGGGGRPCCYGRCASSGHGLDTSLSERVEEYVDVFAFLFEQLGVKVREK